MNKTILLCLIISLTGCVNRKEQPDIISENQGTTSNVYVENIETIKIPENELPSINVLPNITEEKLQYFGTIGHSIINEDNVNVCNHPSLNGDILFKIDKGTPVFIVGTSKEMDDIENYIGNWLRIKVDNHSWGREGWVFSKYIENGQVRASALSIINMPPKEERRAQTLIGSYQINGIEKTVILYPRKEENQNFYTFAYDIGYDSFHYSNIPGSYAWYPETNELKHISYIGTRIESGWVKFTNDFKYILEDFGTSTGPRGLGIWQVEDDKEIFSGLYYRNINLRGYTVDVIYVYDDWNISNNRLDSEILNYAEEYKKNNPVPDDMATDAREKRLGLELIILCEFNMDTGIRKIINGQYIYTQ